MKRETLEGVRSFAEALETVALDGRTEAELARGRGDRDAALYLESIASSINGYAVKVRREVRAREETSDEAQ